MRLHPDKIRMFEFGRYAARRRARRGLGKPETFNFLGFTYICSRSSDYDTEPVMAYEHVRTRL